MSTPAFYPLPIVDDETRPTTLQQRRPISDVHLFHGDNGGDIAFDADQLVLSDGLLTAVYLSLFGGNADDSGLPGDLSRQWWGNFSEVRTERRYRSETQHLLQTLPPTTGNLRRLELAVKNDLAWMVDRGLVSRVDSFGSMPARNTVLLAGDLVIAADTEPQRFEYQRPWGVRPA